MRASAIPVTRRVLDFTPFLLEGGVGTQLYIPSSANCRSVIVRVPFAFTLKRVPYDSFFQISRIVENG